MYNACLNVSDLVVLYNECLKAIPREASIRFKQVIFFLFFTKETSKEDMKMRVLTYILYVIMVTYMHDVSKSLLCHKNWYNMRC